MEEDNSRRKTQTQGKLGRFDVLVHAFHREYYHDRHTDEIKFKGGRWGNRVRRIAKDPRRILIVIPDVEHEHKKSPEMKYFQKRFYDFIRRELGVRAVFYYPRDGDPYNPTFTEPQFISELEKAGYTIEDLKVAKKGRIYGDDWSVCVKAAQRNLKRLTGRIFPRDPWLSASMGSTTSISIKNRRQARKSRGQRKGSRPKLPA